MSEPTAVAKKEKALDRLRVMPQEIWSSIFRHPLPETDLGRSQTSFTNFFLHIHPVKVDRHTLKPWFTMGLGLMSFFLFVILVLGAIARLSGFSIFKFMKYIREELLIVLGTSSSEPVLPQLIVKMQRLGASRSVVGLVIPTGYSFNLDGTNIYMTLTTLFIAQALGVDLTWTEQLTILLVAMLTSKGAAAVTGSGFVTLAATLAAFPTIPVAGLTLLLGVDRFMSEARALTNFIGNGVATIVVAHWEGELDRDALRRAMDGELTDAPMNDDASAPIATAHTPAHASAQAASAASPVNAVDGRASAAN